MSSVKKIVEEGNQAAFASFIETLVPKILPYVEPMIQGITDAFGESEFLIVIKKDIKTKKVFCHIVKSTDVDEFKVKKVARSIELTEFFQKSLSGEVKTYFEEIKNDIDNS